MLIQSLQKLQEKAVCLINFETKPNVVGQLLKDSNILKLTHFIKYKYALFIRNSLRKKNIPIFNEFYTLFNQNHVYNTRGSITWMLVVPQFKLPTIGNILLNQDQSMQLSENCPQENYPLKINLKKIVPYESCHYSREKLKVVTIPYGLYVAMKNKAW